VIDRLRALANRPMPEHQRTAAFVLAAAVLLGAAAFFMLGVPSSAPAPVATPAPAPAPPATERPGPTDPPADRPDPTPREVRRVKRTARQFLRGYLPYSYGQGSAERIQGASDELLAELADRPPRVALNAPRGRRAKVTAVQAEAASAERMSVLAFVEDSERDYALELALERVGETWRVSDVGL
jgi:hypothetical protein